MVLGAITCQIEGVEVRKRKGEKTMRLLKSLGSVAITCLALGMSGCATYQHPEYSSDRRIDRQVKDNLAHSSAYGFPNVAVHTRGGVVELDGYVDTAQQQTDAEQLAASVPGVRQVIDNLRSAAP